MEDEMKNKIWMCLIIFAIAIINISCNNETEGNTIGAEKSLNDNLEYTDESLAEESSIYRNPIDQYFLAKMVDYLKKTLIYGHIRRISS